MKYIVLLTVFLMLSSCSPTLKASYSKLSSAEKTWTVFHPFRAKRAYKISLEAEKITDSIKLQKVLGTDIAGGQLDAFKHSYWMARLTQGIGRRAAYSLGKAHEKGNYQTFKNRQLEDGILPDKPSSEMDLYNNQIGISIGKRFKNSSKDQLIQLVTDSIVQGKMRVLLKDKHGYFLNCTQKRIPPDSLKGKWNTNKCLVPSNYSSW